VGAGGVVGLGVVEGVSEVTLTGLVGVGVGVVVAGVVIWGVV